MNEAELIPAFHQTLDAINSNIEFWLSATFASNVFFGIGFWTIMIIGTCGTVMFVVSTKRKIS